MPICLVQHSCLLCKCTCLLKVSSPSENLCFLQIKIEYSWCVLNTLVDEFHGIVKVIYPEIVLTEEVVKPNLDSWVLLFLVVLHKNHIFLHIAVHL